jgi:uncharacterized Rmd1/YagE family protein
VRRRRLTSTRRGSSFCLLCERFEDEKIFVFRFGSVVFLNVPPAEHEYYLLKLGIAGTAPTPSYNNLTEDHFSVLIEPGVTKVSFNSATMPDADLNRIQLVAMVLAQSSALELVEREVDEFLAQSETMTGLFKSDGGGGSRRKLLQFLGKGLSTRHRIVNQLALLKEPDKTWEKEDLYLLYKALFANFEIDDRIEKCDRMLQLSSQVTELLLEIVNARRAELLEVTIIVLICVEIIKSFFG